MRELKFDFQVSDFAVSFLKFQMLTTAHANVLA